MVTGATNRSHGGASDRAYREARVEGLLAQTGRTGAWRRETAPSDAVDVEDAVDIPMPVEPPEVAEAIARSARDAAQPDPAQRPGPVLTTDELETQMAADEFAPFVGVAPAWHVEPNNVVPAQECAAVTELLDRKDPRHASELAIAARRKEISDLNKHKFADWAHTVRIDEWERAGSPGTWTRKMMLTSIKNAEKEEAEQLFKGRLVDCGHRVYDCRRRDVTELQRADLKAKNLVVRPVSATEWRAAFVAEAAASLDDGYEMALLLADELQAYVKTRRPTDSPPRHLLVREPDL